MRAVAQRCRAAAVRVDDALVAEIGPGLCVFVAAGQDDGADDVRYMAAKLAGLRVFPLAADDRRMDRCLAEVGGTLLLVPQFTLYGDIRRGLRPDFRAAAAPEAGRAVLADLVAALRTAGVRVAEGIFGADMRVLVDNDGPVTIWIESPRGRG